MNTKGQEGIGTAFGILFAILFLGGLWALWAFSIVDYNEYAFVNKFGNLQSDIKSPGINYIGFGSVIRVSNQIRNQEIIVDASSKDLQAVKIDLNINMRLKSDKAYDFVKNYRDETTYTTYLNNKIQEKIKVILLKYNVQDFINNRTEVSKDIYDDIKSINELNYFEINDVSVKNIEYSDALKNTLERKGQVLLEREIIVRQKENIALVNENMQSTNMSDYFKYTIAEKWDGKSALTIIGGN